MGGQIMDVSIVEAPRQRNNREEKEAIKSGDVPKSWEDNPAKLRQKDRSARWILKRGRKKDSQSQLMVPAFGDTSHINIDRRHGLIRTWTATDAAAHDGARDCPIFCMRATAPVWSGRIRHIARARMKSFWQARDASP